VFGDPTQHPPRAPANPRLLKALSAAAGSNDAAVRHGLYEALLNSTIVVPVRPGEGQSLTLRSVGPTRGPVELLMVEDEKGTSAVPVFTDFHAMQRWMPGNLSFVAVPLHQFLRESFPCSASGIWLNIADRASRFVSRQELAAIASSLVSPTYAQQVERDLSPVHADFAVEPLDPMPGDLVQRLIRAIKPERDVTQGFLMKVIGPDRSARLAAAIRLARVLDDPGTDALLKRIARQLNEGRARRRSIEVVLLDYARYSVVRRTIEPIYEQQG
jgi:hypothetical protein